MPAPKPATPPAVVPHLTVADAAAAIEFHKKAFGAVEIARHLAPAGRRVMHAAVTINGQPIMLNDDFPEFSGKPRTPRALGGSPVVIHLNVPDVDAAWQRAVKAGAGVTMPRSLRDPQGHEWSMSSPKKLPSARELEAGAKKAFGRGAARLPRRGKK